MFDLKVERLSSECDISQCATLLAEVYAEEGYIDAASKYYWAMETLCGFLDNAHRFIFVAKQGNKVVGMVSYQIEGLLPIESVFPEELAKLRKDNALLAYIGSFVIDKSYRSGPVAIMLLHSVQRNLCRIRNLNIICVVNEHHTNKYRGFKLLARAGNMQGMTTKAKACLLLRKLRNEITDTVNQSAPLTV